MHSKWEIFTCQQNNGKISHYRDIIKTINSELPNFMSQDEVDYSNRQVLIAKALKRVLRPFVKLMLANDLGYTFAIDLLKGLFVDVAQNDFRIDGKRQTDARISLITGVHRKDVKRLRTYQPDVTEVVPDNVSLGSQLIALWNAEQKYLDEDGLPKPLPRFVADNAAISFEDLVRSVSKDIHPRAVLDEWLRLGIATLDDQNRVCLTTDAFIPEKGFSEKIFYFGNNLHDHAQATVSNVLGQHQPFLERCVHYEGLTQSSIDELAELAEKNGMKALREVNHLANESFEKDAQLPRNHMRMTFGLYFYYAPLEEPVTREGGE